MKLLSTGNPKILKGLAQGYNTYILHLAPADLSGYNTCPKATVGCKSACLNTAGRGGLFKKGTTTNVIQEARMRKTAFFFEERKYFMEWLVADIELAIKQSAKKGLVPVFRLNGTSDLSWEKYEVVRNGEVFTNIFAAFPDIQFYDYTKDVNRKDLPANYDVTFSYSGVEGFQPFVNKALLNNMRMAVVFRRENDIPQSFMGIPVVSGDNSDVRHLDDKVIVGLYAKGKAKLDTTGFVV